MTVNPFCILHNYDSVQHYTVEPLLMATPDHE